MFGARGDEPQAWHFYTKAEVENLRHEAEECERDAQLVRSVHLS